MYSRPLHSNKIGGGGGGGYFPLFVCLFFKGKVWSTVDICQLRSYFQQVSMNHFVHGDRIPSREKNLFYMQRIPIRRIRVQIKARLKFSKLGDACITTFLF